MSFNVFWDGSTPGGLDSDGSNVSSITNISVGGVAFSAMSLGAYAVPIDAIEATWVQPCMGGPCDPSEIAIYFQLTILGPSGPSEFYRMGDYFAGGGTYADPPDIFTLGGCSGTNGACASLTFASGPTPVDIDIKPGSDPNSINLCSMGVIPVAIFGSATFNVNDINRTSLALADVGVKMAGKSGKDLCHVTDVNDDSFDDLVCQFVAVGLALSGGDTTATVVGELNDATPFEGTDSVNIVKDTCG